MFECKSLVNKQRGVFILFAFLHIEAFQFKAFKRLFQIKKMDYQTDVLKSLLDKLEEIMDLAKQIAQAANILPADNR